MVMLKYVWTNEGVCIVLGVTSCESSFVVNCKHNKIRKQKLKNKLDGLEASMIPIICDGMAGLFGQRNRREFKSVLGCFLQIEV